MTQSRPVLGASAPQVFYLQDSTSKFCVTETLETLQTDTNNNITLAYLSGILGGDTSSFAALEQSFQSGHMCTSCVAG